MLCPYNSCYNLDKRGRRHREIELWSVDWWSLIGHLISMCFSYSTHCHHYEDEYRHMKTMHSSLCWKWIMYCLHEDSQSFLPFLSPLKKVLLPEYMFIGSSSLFHVDGWRLLEGSAATAVFNFIDCSHIVETEMTTMCVDTVTEVHTLWKRKRGNERKISPSRA